MRSFVVVVAALAACSPAPTYSNKTKAIFDAKCNGCHRAGGIGPMPLTTYADIKSFKDIVVPAIASGVMPPWMADDSCNSYANDYSLSDDEKATLAAWFDAEMPEGDSPAPAAAAAVHDPKQKPIRYDELLDAAPEPYDVQSDDNYRCYAIAWPHDVEKYITGFDLIPGDPSNVHHVNIFLNPPASAPGGFDFVGADEADPLAGYDCGAGDRVLASALIGAWAPGASGTLYPEGTGQLVVPGSSITLEVHYARKAGSIPDKSQLALQTADSVTQRGLGVAFYSFSDWPQGGMPIPANQPSVTHDLEVDPALELAVVAPWIHARTIGVHVAALHMHQLGKSGELSIHGDDGVNQCLLKVPEWNFSWQMGYVLDHPATLVLGHDKLYLSCTWDNTAAHQPIVDGVKLTPRDVNWGERTIDEMCIGFLYLVPDQ